MSGWAGTNLNVFTSQDGSVMVAQNDTKKVEKQEKAGMDHKCSWLRTVAQ